jgi:hypothetical protein
VLVDRQIVSAGTGLDRRDDGVRRRVDSADHARLLVRDPHGVVRRFEVGHFEIQSDSGGDRAGDRIEPGHALSARNPHGTRAHGDVVGVRCRRSEQDLAGYGIDLAGLGAADGDPPAS